LNAHPEQPERHSYALRLDPRLPLLDELAETFKRHKEWKAYHHVRAVAHGLDFHLTSCVGGPRADRG
jgi:hypothetical protein